MGLEAALAEVRVNLAFASSTGEVRIGRFIAIRFRGQTHHLDVALDDDPFGPEQFRRATTVFEQQYDMLFGHGASYSGAGYEILAVRVIGSAALPPLQGASASDPLEPRATRTVVFDDPSAPVATAIYRTSRPREGSEVSGPCIIEFPGQSVVVPPGARARADRFGHLHVRLGA
jgi:N-methylhydantoinase A